MREWEEGGEGVREKGRKEGRKGVDGKKGGKGRRVEGKGEGGWE